MKIAYVTTYDATDIRQWSGLGYYISKSLEGAGISLAYIGPLNEKRSLPLSAKQRLYSRIFKKRYLRERDPFVLRSYARQVTERLSNIDVDVVFSPGTIPIAYLEHKQPLVFWADATFAGMVDFYPEFSNLCRESIRNGNAMEKAALERCTLAIYSSEWAAKTAVDYYNINNSKVKVVPFGANINCDREYEDIKEIVESRPSDKCKLLFLGVDWGRKGGKIALEVAKKLIISGLNAERLTIAGCQPKIRGELKEFVKVLGFISKKTRD